MAPPDPDPITLRPPPDPPPHQAHELLPALEQAGALVEVVHWVKCGCHGPVKVCDLCRPRMLAILRQAWDAGAKAAGTEAERLRRAIIAAERQLACSEVARETRVTRPRNALHILRCALAGQGYEELC